MYRVSIYLQTQLIVYLVFFPISPVSFTPSSPLFAFLVFNFILINFLTWLAETKHQIIYDIIYSRKRKRVRHIFTK